MYDAEVRVATEHEPQSFLRAFEVNMSRGTATLTYKNLLDYLKALPKDALTALYRSPAACLAVFR